jgi:hypothetical protein
MTPIVFYGSPQGVLVKKPLSLLRLLCEIRIDLKKHTESIPRCLILSMFMSMCCSVQSPSGPLELHAPGDPPAGPDSPSGVPAQGGLTDFGRATRGTGLHRRAACGPDFDCRASRGFDVLSCALRGPRGAATS